MIAGWTRESVEPIAYREDTLARQVNAVFQHRVYLGYCTIPDMLSFIVENLTGAWSLIRHTEYADSPASGEGYSNTTYGMSFEMEEDAVAFSARFAP